MLGGSRAGRRWWSGVLAALVVRVAGAAGAVWAEGLPPELESRAAAPVWRAFWAVTAIHRPSKGEEALRRFIEARAAARGCPSARDRAGNLLVRVPAAPGLEGRPSVALQGHLDMVCVTRPGAAHRWGTDPIRPVIRDGWLTAEDTSLGADNGLGVAAMLALLEGSDPAVRHGPLELLFTVDEEGDFSGVGGLTPGWLKSSRLINLDSEEDGEFNIGCAGGQADTLTFVGARQEPPAGHVWVRFSLTGGRGGHSGVDIHRGRANAIVWLARFLERLSRTVPVRLGTFTGGTVDTAIPADAGAITAVPARDWPAVVRAAVAFRDRLPRMFGRTDPGLRFRCERLPGRLTGPAPGVAPAIRTGGGSRPFGQEVDPAAGIGPSSASEDRLPPPALAVASSASPVGAPCDPDRAGDFPSDTDLPADPPGGHPVTAFLPDRSAQVLAALTELPCGIQAMSRRFPGQVQTSANPGVIRLATASLQIVSHLQGSSLEAIRWLSWRWQSVADRFGGILARGTPYPPWEPAPSSPLVNRAVAVHERLFGRRPLLKVVHAGLECGAMAPLFPGLDMLSFGPGIVGPHAPGERVDIASVDRFWTLLTALLAALAEEPAAAFGGTAGAPEGPPCRDEGQRPAPGSPIAQGSADAGGR